MVGEAYGNVTAKNCYVNATIQSNGVSTSGDKGVGGIVGFTNMNNVTVTNSYVAGSIYGQRVGGIGGRCGYTLLTDCVVAATISNGSNEIAAFAAVCLNSSGQSKFERCVFTGALENPTGSAAIFTAQENKDLQIKDCILFGATTTNNLSAVKTITGTLSCSNVYCDTTVYTGLANTDGVVNINGMELGGANGAKNLSALFSEANRVNWTITDTCPMPSNALKGRNVANLEMLAFQTTPETVTGAYNIRFVGFIDGVDYKEAGVIIKAGDKTATVKAKHVYSSIYEKLGNAVNAVGITDYGYAENDGYFLAIILEGVPTSVTEFTVTPYVVTNDNVTVYGVPGTASVTVTQ